MLLFRQSDLQFLSTLSLRRATGGKQSFIRMDRIFLSTLSLRRATLSALVLQVIPVDFYPRSPCGERRARGHRGWHHPKRFLSTLSLRRATLGAHSPLEDLCYFYPRSPCGERHDAVAPVGVAGNISIHALLAESDASSSAMFSRTAIFYPRSPCGERPLR